MAGLQVRCASGVVRLSAAVAAVGYAAIASAAFATPFGYQTNVLVFQMGGYRYMDLVRVGLPLNAITAVVAVLAIPMFFPF